MKRREFITLLGGAAVAWPVPARAQQAGKLPVIGFLGPATAATQSQWAVPMVRRLRELNWIEGRNIVIEYRWAEGRAERAAEVASEFVRLRVDVIVTIGTPTTTAAKAATSLIPIVFCSVSGPVETGLVASLARPGGNITGLSNQMADTGGKRLEILRELIPHLRRLATIGNSTNPAATVEMAQIRAQAQGLGLTVISPEIRQAEDFATAFESFKGQVDALYVQTDLLTISNRIRINTLALEARLPTMHGIRDFVELGGLVSYGHNIADLLRRAGDYVDKRCQTERSTGGAADQIRPRAQLDHCQSTRSHCTAIAARPRRRGDRMKRRAGAISKEYWPPLRRGPRQRAHSHGGVR
jgi:putative tryptophan/tyrosine transport system substrate-binding protein